MRSWLLICFCIYCVGVQWYWKMYSSVTANFCGPYLNSKYWFSSSVGLWKVVKRVPVEYSELFTSIYCFAWSKYPSSSSFKFSSVDCWLVCIIFIGSELIDPENFPWTWLKNLCGSYTNRTYVFASPAGLWKVLARVRFFILTSRHKWIDWLQGISLSHSFLKLCR